MREHVGKANMAHLPFVLAELVKGDEVLCDPEMNLFTLQTEKDRRLGQVEFEKFSQRLAKYFPSCSFDEDGRVVAGLETPKQNFNSLKSILLSTDLEMSS